MEINFWEIIKNAVPFFFKFWPALVILLVIVAIKLFFDWFDRNKKIGGSSQSICPKCGGKIVNRNGKFGDFYGCSNYPKCKYTSPL